MGGAYGHQGGRVGNPSRGEGGWIWAYKTRGPNKGEPGIALFLTLFVLRYLKTRIRWGGVNLTPPPSKSHVWCPNITNDTSLESSCALLLECAKKFANLQKLIFFCKIQLYSKIVCKKIIFQKIINYTYLKSPWPCHFKYAKSFAKF